MTNEPSIKVKVKIHSQKRHEAQHKELHIPLADAPTEAIAPRKQRTYEEIMEEVE